MNFLNLHYFCVTAEELSFTKASRRLFISQQSLSNHIAKLEAEFNMLLFNRTQPMTLTAAGECLYTQGQALLNQKRQTEQALQDIRDFRSGDLTIGVSTSRGSVMLPQILPQFRNAYPQIRLRLVEGTTQEINAALYEGHTDVNLGFAIHDPELIAEELLHDEHLVCMIPNAFLKSYLGETVETLPAGSLQPFSRFSACPFVSMPQSFWLGTVFEDCCHDYGVTPEIVMETSSMSTLVSLCAAGMGAIFLAESFVRQDSLFWRKQETTAYLLDYPNAMRSITVSWSKKHYQTRAAREFVRMAKEIFAY